MPKTAYCEYLSKPKSCAKATTSPISPLLEKQSQLQLSTASTGRRLRCQHHTSAVETALTELPSSHTDCQGTRVKQYHIQGRAWRTAARPSGAAQRNYAQLEVLRSQGIRRVPLALYDELIIQFSS